MSNETKIEGRLRAVVAQIAPNQTARYDLLSSRTAIARHRWVNWINRRQSLSLEMLEAFLDGWPELAPWVVAGLGTPPTSRHEQIEVIELSRDDLGRAVTNVPHVVSQYGKGSPPVYDWGYDGSGPRELGMNILYHLGVEGPVADFFARHFVENFLDKVPTEGGSIATKGIKKWLEEISEEIRRKTEEHHRLEELRRENEERVRQAMEQFNSSKE